MIKFNKVPSKWWNTITKMSYLQRRVIVYSILYYNHSISLVSDTEYDDISRQLVNMIKENPEEYKKTKYFYAMRDFDGSTGFDLFYRLNDADKSYLLYLVDVLIKQRGLL